MKKLKLKVTVISIVAVIVLVVIALPMVLKKAGLHPSYDGEHFQFAGGRALIITTSHGFLAESGSTEGEPTGVFASEMTHPYYVFKAAGMDVDVASIEGGQIPIDPMSFSRMIRSAEDERFLEDTVFQAKAKNSIAITSVDVSNYDVIFLAGGWGAAYDMGYSEDLGQLVSQAYYSPRKTIISSVCHGALGLIQAKDGDGNLLVSGRRATGVTDKQIKELGIEVTPMHPETELRKAGVIFESATAFRDIFATRVVVDEEQRFVTGQNQNSGLETAHTVVKLLVER
jgi:putative intracellular protease/amidase